MPTSIGGLGSPLLSAGRIGPAPIPSGTAVRILTRKHVVGVSLILFMLSLVSAGSMTVLYHPSVAAGDFVSAHTARNIGFGAGVFGFSLVFLTVFYRHLAPFTAPVYAVAGGVFMSGLALGLEARYPGIALQSIGVSLAVFCTMLLLYATRLITVTRKVFTIVYAATSAIAIIYLMGFVLLFLGFQITFLHGAGTGAAFWFGFLVIVAASNLLIDFERIAKLEDIPQPECMAWYTGLSLMVTLVWLYISVLRLIANLRR